MEWEWVHEFSLSPARPFSPEPARGSCFFICSIFFHPLALYIYRSPKSWHVAGAVAPTASQPLPLQARTQPIALGLCLKMVPAICFCFSDKTHYFSAFPIIASTAHPTGTPSHSGRSFLLWFQLQIASPYMCPELHCALSRHMPDTP